MPLYNHAPKPRTQFSLLHRSLIESDELPLRSLVSDERIAEIFAEEEVDFGQTDDVVYTPAITLWGLLSQVFFKEEQRSCLAAVVRIAALWLAMGRKFSAVMSTRLRFRLTVVQRALFMPLTGRSSDLDLMQTRSDAEFRRVFVTEPCALNKPPREFSLDHLFNATVTRIIRTGIEMTARGATGHHPVSGVLATTQGVVQNAALFCKL